MSKLSGGQTSKPTGHRSAACIAVPGRPSTGGKQQIYDASVHVTKPSRFFVMDAPAFATFMKDQFPMAVHLLDGIAVGTERTRRIIDNREKLLALGQLSAGLTHQLNNPAAATARAAADLRDRIAGMRGKLAMLADGTVTPEALRALVRLARARSPSRSPSRRRSTSARSRPPTAKTRSATGWRNTASTAAGTIAPTFVEGGIDTDWLDRISAITDELDASTSLEQAIRWINYTIESELLMNQIAEASKRISALVADAKQYSQMDRAPFQVADVHDLLTQHADDVRRQVGQRRARPGTSRWSRNSTNRFREIPCYPGDLNQVWTNIIDNAIAAMGSAGGTLTIRTCREAESMAARGDLRHRARNPRGHPRAHLRAVLHHQTLRGRHRAGAGSGLEHHRRRSIAAICGWNRCPATPGSSCCSRWSAPAADVALPTDRDVDDIASRHEITIHRNSGAQALGCMTAHDRFCCKQTQSRPVRIVRTRRNACSKPKKSRPWATAPSG